MNVFYLDKNPEICAKYHCDKHAVKMILEYSRMLSTAHRLLDDEPSEELYKIAYVNHPMTIWTRSHIENYKYVRDLWHYLCIEYSLRYEKVHSCEKLDYEFFSDPDNIEREAEPESIPLCMPDMYKESDPVTSYRNFYKYDKVRFATWKQPSEKPYWMN